MMKYPQIRGLQRSGEGEEPACKVPCYSMKEYIITSGKLDLLQARGPQGGWEVRETLLEGGAHPGLRSIFKLPGKFFKLHAEKEHTYANIFRILVLGGPSSYW